MLFRVTVHWISAAGALRSETYDVDRPTAREAEEACVREVLRQPGREIVGVDVERVK